MYSFQRAWSDRDDSFNQRMLSKAYYINTTLIYCTPRPFINQICIMSM